MSKNKIESESLDKFNRLSNYISVAQIFLDKNFLLKKKIEPEDIKKRLLGHWGTCPGISFVYGQTNRQIINNKNRDFIFTVGTGHGFPAYQAGTFLDGSLSHFYPEKIPYSKDGLSEIIQNFSTPYGYPSHLNPTSPAVIAEGGELGYSLSIAAGTILDNKDLINICLIGDGEAETGPLSASWNVNKFISPKTDGAFLPILHLNGYKISGPTVFGRTNNSDIKNYFKGLGYKVYFIDQHRTKKSLQLKGIEIFDKAISRIKKIQQKAREGQEIIKPKWPIIILRTDKGMTGPKKVDGKKIVGNNFSHQTVFETSENLKENKENLLILENWLKSYKIEELISFDKNGQVILDKDIKKFIPEIGRTIGTNKKAFAYFMQKDLHFPKENLYIKQELEKKSKDNSMKEAGSFLEKIISKNDNVRIFCPDETYSNKLGDVFNVTNRVSQLPIKSFDRNIAKEGKVIELLSEHVLFGMLWGYIQTGRNGFFVTYESFGQIISSMAGQYVKFLKASKTVKFRKEVPSINIVLSSLIERQDHNGFSHQNPSLISDCLDTSREITNVYFPADKNLNVASFKKALQTKSALNIIVAGKKMTRIFLTEKEVEEQLDKEILIWKKYSDKNPDLVFVTCGDYVTEEAIVGLKLFREIFPEIKIQFVNILKLDILAEENPKVSNQDILKKYLTEKKHILFNYHGYPETIKKLLFDYNLSERIIINGYRENGSTTSPFDMLSRNELSRFDIIKNLTELAYRQKLISEEKQKEVKEKMEKNIKDEITYIIENKDDPDYIKNW